MPSRAITASAGNGKTGIVPKTILRIGAPYRRCCWYLFASSWLMAGTVLLVRQQAGHPPVGAGPGLVAALLLPALTLLLLLTAESWRMRVDLQGISRCRWCFWSTWPWEAFRAGRIYRNLGSGRYVFPERPIGDRQLYLDWLADDDRTLVDQLCRQALPNTCNPTAEIIAKGQGRLTSEGIFLFSFWGKRPGPLIPWSDVERLQLRWERLQHRLMCHVELKAKDGRAKTTAFQRLDAIAPSGESTPLTNQIEQVEQFVAPLLKPDRFVSFQVFDFPRSSTEATRQVEHYQQQLRFARWFFLLANALGFIAAAGLFLGEIIPGARLVWAEPLLAWQWKVAILSCGVLITLIGPLLLAGLAWITLADLRKRLARAKAVPAASA